MWGFSWQEIKKYYVQKQKEQIDRTNSFCTFLMELAQACFGGGKKDDEISLDSGEGIDEMTDEQLARMKEVLGEADFSRLYGHLI